MDGVFSGRIVYTESLYYLLGPLEHVSILPKSLTFIFNLIVYFKEKITILLNIQHKTT